MEMSFPPHSSNKQQAVRDIRSSNIELLRIITAIGVYVLHYNNPLSGKALSISGGGGSCLFTGFRSDFLQCS